jgi:hypothetical protein
MARAEERCMSFGGNSTCTTLDQALVSHADASSRPVDALDARDRRIIAAVIRALQRLLDEDDIRPALQEEQHARIVVHDDKVLLLAAVSTQAIHRSPDDRRPALQPRPRRSFVFG